MAVKIKKGDETPPKKSRAGEGKYINRPNARKKREPEDLTSPDGGAHKRLLTMGQDKIDALTSRMVAGDTFSALARMIQGEWKLLVDVKEMTLIKELSRFRKDRIDGKLMFLAKTEYGTMVADRFAKSIDVHEQLTTLVQIQQERVTKMLEREKHLPTLLTQTKLEIMALSALYGQLSQLQMDLGLIRRVPKELMVASVEVAASKAQEMIEKAMSSNKNVEAALSKAFLLIEGEFSEISDDAVDSTPPTR